MSPLGSSTFACGPTTQQRQPCSQRYNTCTTVASMEALHWLWPAPVLLFHILLLHLQVDSWTTEWPQGRDIAIWQQISIQMPQNFILHSVFSQPSRSEESPSGWSHSALQVWTGPNISCFSSPLRYLLVLVRERIFLLAIRLLGSLTLYSALISIYRLGLLPHST